MSTQTAVKWMVYLACSHWKGTVLCLRFPSMNNLKSVHIGMSEWHESTNFPDELFENVKHLSTHFSSSNIVFGPSCRLPHFILMSVPYKCLWDLHWWQTWMDQQHWGNIMACSHWFLQQNQLVWFKFRSFAEKKKKNELFGIAIWTCCIIE